METTTDNSSKWGAWTLGEPVEEQVLVRNSMNTTGMFRYISCPNGCAPFRIAAATARNNKSLAIRSHLERVQCHLPAEQRKSAERPRDPEAVVAPPSKRHRTRDKVHEACNRRIDGLQQELRDTCAGMEALKQQLRDATVAGVATGVPVAPGIEALQQQLARLEEASARCEEASARREEASARRHEQLMAALDVSDHASDDDAGVKKVARFAERKAEEAASRVYATVATAASCSPQRDGETAVVFGRRVSERLESAASTEARLRRERKQFKAAMEKEQAANTSLEDELDALRQCATEKSVTDTKHTKPLDILLKEFHVDKLKSKGGPISNDWDALVTAFTSRMIKLKQNKQ